ncbi:MAG: hypothetical protein ACLR1T_12565 [Evtepia gabavorous]
MSGYAKDALAWANAQKLITGVTDTTLNPQGSATAPRWPPSSCGCVRPW